ncbi:MAG TPA: hypothetical protein VGL30_14875 [Phenylobacterium sp.]
MLKTFGYLVSTVSVALLGVVSWNSARENPVLFACLAGGMAASVAGMLLRWLAWRQEQRDKRELVDAARLSSTESATTIVPRGSTSGVPSDAANFGAGT